MINRSLADRLNGAFNSDLVDGIRGAPMAIAAAAATAAIAIAAIGAPWLAPHNPLDLASLDLLEAFTPPAWLPGGSARFPLGTDDQGRDVLSTIMYGTRASLLVGFGSVLVALVLGVSLGLISGYAGGLVDAVIMRAADVQLTFPSILIALMIDGIVRGAIGVQRHDDIAILVLIVSISLSTWVQYARAVRGSVMVERDKEYVQAARVTGLPAYLVAIRHVLPNVMRPVVVIATINLAVAIVTEATLSFLGVGLPPTSPSLGTLIRVGNDFLFSGEWWIIAFPGLVLAVLVVAVNLLGDWLSDARNPRLR